MKLSIVVSARNDDYGGNFLHRFQASVNALAALAARHSLDAELIVVEWNPPAAPRLKQALAWPAFPTRILTVPNEIHRRIEGSDRMPIFEYAAKNAGIRRSTSDFVLATNADIIFSGELVQLLTRNLDDRAFYRAHRHDVRGLVPVEAPIDEQLAFCRAHVFRATEFKGGKYRFSRARKVAGGEIGIFRALNYKKAYTDGCGDFLLMARSRWEAMRGYPEFLSHGTIDSYGVELASYLGMSQIIFEHPIYHQDHDRGQTSGRPVAPWKEELIGKRNEESKWGLPGVELEAWSNA